MGDDLAGANVNRSYSLAATSIAIFMFMLFFLYPRFVGGEISALVFQATLVVMGVATFSFVFASLYYCGWASGRRVGVVRTLAGVPALRDSLLPQGPDRAGECWWR